MTKREVQRNQMRGEEMKNKELIMTKNEERSGKCDENKNDNDDDKNEDARMIKRELQTKHSCDEELTKTMKKLQ